ncbi:MAG TPA: outer membrane beta-barrel protein [Mucilaginibacter sp.]
MKYFFRLIIVLFATAPVFCFGQQQPDNTYKPGFYASAGLNFETNSPSSQSVYYKVGGRSYTSHLPALAFGINFPADPETGKVNFRLEAGAAFARYNWLYTNQVTPRVPARTSFNTSSFYFAPQMVYNFYNAENLKIFGGVGVVVVKSSYSNVYYGPQNPGTDFPETQNFFFVNFDTRVLLKAGIKVQKHIEASVTYFTNAETTNRGFFQLNKTNNIIGITYYF